MNSLDRNKGWYTWVGTVVLLVIAGFLADGGWRMFENQQQAGCVACGRPIAGHSSTIALVDGEQQHFCCAACAMSVERQSGTDVLLQSLKLHGADEMIDPDDAFVVVGSSVNHCMRTEPLVGSEKHLSHLEFDRCSPSVMTFASREDADQFAAQFGGKVARGGELPAIFASN
jgi:nitrous oxide reductase accessory protein NosL